MDLPIRAEISNSHRVAINSYCQAGTWLDAATREKILDEYRFANQSECELCTLQKEALSPYSVMGEHDRATDLSASIVDVVHRVTRDSGRLTERWFREKLGSGLSEGTYIEVLGCVATAIILDTFAMGIGTLKLSPEGELDMSEPSRIANPEVVKEEAWVPISQRTYELGPSGLPTVPNITRAMGLVPGAVQQFFSVMRSHYGLTEIASSLSRSQVELIAARTSSYNDCFY